MAFKATESMKAMEATNIPNTRSKSKANAFHSTHIMRLRSAISRTESSLSLSTLSLRTPTQKPKKNIAINSNSIKQMSDSIAKLTIARKRANSECSDSNGGNGSNPKSRKRICLMEKVVTPMEAEQPLSNQTQQTQQTQPLPPQQIQPVSNQTQPLPPSWPDDLTDAELVEMFQMPIVYTFPNGVEEYNREMFIQYIKHHSSSSSRNESKFALPSVEYTIPPPLSTIPQNIPYNTAEHPKCEYSPDCDCLRTGLALG